MASTLGRLAPVILVGSLSFCILNSSYAEVTQVGRYLTAENKPKSSQIDLLSQEFQVRFPSFVQTIGNAMEYLLKQSGYSLVPEDKRSTALKVALSKPLPAIDREFGPMKLKDGLATLAGPVFILVNDPLNRMVSFNLSSKYSALYQKNLSK
jgi:type IV pili sensor histidine kinase/response regulator